MVTLAPPNGNIKTQLLKVIANALRTGNVSGAHLRLARLLVAAMFQGAEKKYLLQNLLQSVVAHFPHPMLKEGRGAPDIESAQGLESTYNVLLSSWLMLGSTEKYHHLGSELSSSIMVMATSDLRNVCLIECKLGLSTHTALQQIRHKGSTNRFPAYETVTLIGINVTEDRKVEVAIQGY
jgi:hypothetical protein